MKKLFFILFLCTGLQMVKAQDADSSMIKKIYSNALSDSTAYKNLQYLCTKIGGGFAVLPKRQKQLSGPKVFF
jgi:hypothetical protein